MSDAYGLPADRDLLLRMLNELSAYVQHLRGTREAADEVRRLRDSSEFKDANTFFTDTRPDESGTFIQTADGRPVTRCEGQAHLSIVERLEAAVHEAERRARTPGPSLLTSRRWLFRDGDAFMKWLRSLPADVSPSLALLRRALALHDAIVDKLNCHEPKSDATREVPADAAAIKFLTKCDPAPTPTLLIGAPTGHAAIASELEEPRTSIGDVGRPRQDPMLIIATPSHLPPVWDGEAKAEFQDNLIFNLTALRADLAHLIDRAKSYREAWGSEEAPPDAAGETVRRHAFYVWHYFAGLTREVDEAIARCEMVIPPPYLPPLKIAVDRVVATSFGMTPVQSANAMSQPEMLRILEWAYRLLPDVRFDRDVSDRPIDAPREAPSEAVAIEAPPKRGPEPPAVDFAAIASALRKAGKPKQAALVEYMADKQEATVAEVAWRVHDTATPDPCADGGDDIARASLATVRKNVERTNKALVRLPSRLSFRVRGDAWNARVFKEIAPE